jgi:hypothetical protein
MMLWATNPAARDAKLAHKALKQKGDQHVCVLIEVACASTPDHLVAVRKAYCAAYDASLEEDVATCPFYKDPLKQVGRASLLISVQILTSSRIGPVILTSFLRCLCRAVPGAARQLVPVLRRVRGRGSVQGGGGGAAPGRGGRQAAPARRRRAHHQHEEQAAAEGDVREVQAGARQGVRGGPRGAPQQRPARGDAQDCGLVPGIA